MEKIKLSIKKELVRFKPRLKLKKASIHKDKKKYDRKKKNKEID